MIVLQANNIHKSYGITPILTNLSLQVHKKDKIGVVGPNGAGKSTFLKIIAGQLGPDLGEIQIAKNKTLCYLAQDSGLESSNTIWDEMLSVYTVLHDQEKQLRSLEEQMGATTKTPEAIAEIMEQYSELQESFERSGGHQMEADIRNVVAGLGFSNVPYKQMKISQCSGGQKTRLALAKILLSKPDVILLDEPTNYLDIDALTWLEQFIRDFSGALLVVSHDRYFLDAFVTSIYEIDKQKGTVYLGKYSAYLALKAQRLLEQEQLYNQQQELIAKTEDFIQRNIARANTSTRAKSRRKQLERLERLDAPEKDSHTSFSFYAKKRSGNIALEISNLSIFFASSTPLFTGLHMQLERGERVAIIGPNGTGKSTLLKMINQQLQPASGVIRLGSNIQIGYYDQEQADLTETNTVFAEIHDCYPHMTKTEVRTALAQFLFVGDDVEKLVSSLSGGEKARVTLTKLMLAEDNLLLLDEPTNHLDIPAKESLEKALINFNGSMLFISHDRYFLNQIATRIIHMTSKKLTSYLGNYDYYIEKKLQEKQLLSEQGTDTLAQQKLTHEDLKRLRNLEKQLQKQYEKLEQDIRATEASINKIETNLCNPEIFDDHVKVAILQGELSNAQQRLEQLLEKWEQIATKMEEIE